MTNRLSEDQQGSFDPGPSFTDGPIPTPDPGMLPTWLQRFGELTAADAPQPERIPEPAPEQPAAEPVNAEPDGGAEDMQIPAWLQEAPAEEPPVNSDPPAHAASQMDVFSGTDFLTDADLPDWLRSIGTPSDVELPVSDEPEILPVAASVATATLPVPQVRKVWVTDQDVQQVSAGASMFAAVAESAGSRPDILVSEAPGQNQAQPADDAKVVTARATDTAAAPADTAETNSIRSPRMRLILIAAVAIVIILLLVMMLGK